LYNKHDEDERERNMKDTKDIKGKSKE